MSVPVSLAPVSELAAPWRQLHVAVVVPAYRVEEWIEEVLATIPGWVRTIVVVDDASPDATAERVARIADPRVRLIRHARNRGVGGATVSGMQAALEAGADLVVKMDGDGQMDPAYLPALLAPLLHFRQGRLLVRQRVGLQLQGAGNGPGDREVTAAARRSASQDRSRGVQHGARPTHDRPRPQGQARPDPRGSQRSRQGRRGHE